MFLPANLPWIVPLTVLFIFGAFLGGQINRGIYRLAWHKRSIGPWSSPHDSAPPRAVSDRLPILGWIGLRREAPLHGTGYWIRPLIIELLCGLGLAELYWWEVAGRLMPNHPGLALPDPITVHVQFLSHAILISLMVVTTFIDIDEKTIPDEITVPGMLVACALAVIWPPSQLPVEVNGAVSALRLTSPNDWTPMLNQTNGLLIGIGCLAGWCYGLLPKTIWTRGGMRKMLVYLVASILRHRHSYRIFGLFVVGAVLIGAVWGLAQGPRWQALLSALLGMAFGGGLIWAVRIVAGYALQREAMGFGDVTLMAMIGAYVGWQPSLIIFFLAPFAGAVVAITQWLLTRRKDIAFGPFLCAASLVLLVYWPFFWERWGPLFMLGWIIPVLFGACLLLMGMMLSVWARLTR